MKPLRLVWILCVLAVGNQVFAQQNVPTPGSDPLNLQRQKYLSLMPFYQSWQVEGRDAPWLDVYQLSNTLQFYYEVNGRVSLSLRNSQAQTRSNCSTCSTSDYTLSGINDTQVSVAYRLPKPDLVLNLGVNAPTGKTALPDEALITTALMGTQAFDFQMPSFGQGTGIMAGISGAFPIGARLVFGGGVGYQMNGAYQPITSSSAKYQPGNELSADLGLTLKTNSGGTFATDFIYAVYGTDRYDKAEVFKAGNKKALMLVYKQPIQSNELTLSARYRSREKNALAQFIGDPVDTETTNSNPAYWAFQSRYRMRLNANTHANLSVEYRQFEATSAFMSGSKTFRFGFDPQISINEHLFVPIRLRFGLGRLENPSLSSQTFSMRHLTGAVGLYWLF